MKAHAQKLLLSAAILLLSACAGDQTVENNHFKVTEKFRGVLPCSGCTGIDTELVLQHDPSTGSPASFYLHETRVDAPGGERVNTSWGNWSKKANNSNQESSIYVLNPEIGRERLYQRDGDGKLQPLDQNGQPVRNNEGVPVALSRLTPDSETH